MNPELVQIHQTNKLQCSREFVGTHYIQPIVHDMLHQAANGLPSGASLIVYEAYRPKSRQLVLWNNVWDKLRELYPDADAAELTERTTVWVANPHTTGSGHQAGAAVDVSIAVDGQVLDMGNNMHVFNEYTKTDAAGITDMQRLNRARLKEQMECVGLVNYPDEWWHYSYGDRLWADVSGRTKMDILFTPYMDD